VPLQQHVTVSGSEQVSFLLQHPSPQNVLMLGSHPHRPVLGSAQIKPAGQQPSPQGVRPAWHPPHWLFAAFEHAWPGGQHVSPHGVEPDSQSLTAAAVNGRKTVAAVAAAAEAPIIFRIPRRETPFADARVSRSNRSLMSSPCWNPSKATVATRVRRT
jgi:hypothetical protein